MMNKDESPSTQELQIVHLRKEFEHLSLMREYHFWAKGTAKDPIIKYLHQAVADRINETMEQLSQLLEGLQKSCS